MDLMNKVFRGLENKILVVFVDDISVFSKSLEEHEEYLRKMFGTLRGHKLKARFSKCNFRK